MVELTHEELRAVLWMCGEVVRPRQIAGQPCPPQVIALQDKLNQAWVSSRRQQNGAVLADSTACTQQVGTRKAAALLGWTERRVQRRAGLLHGEQIAGRWVFPLAEVLNQKTFQETTK
ncbi:hypothetical protein NM962_12595 [Mycobacterium sp. SVM_VP21]|nr:hypothetical protein NM962_12595 [Mycobacterium sp. SVM_VP21]